MIFNLVKKKIDAINIYADESSIDNPSAEYMIIGAVFVNRRMVPAIKTEISKIQREYFINGELKWIKTSAKTLDFYKKLFLYLFSLGNKVFNYRCIIVKKDEVDYDKFHSGDKELAFYKFYYQLLKNRLDEGKKYYIFLDFKPSKSKDRVRRIGEFLELVNQDVIIKHIQAYSSVDNIFIQIADILTGAVGYERNYKKNSVNKVALVKIIANAIGKENLDFCSTRSNDQIFNTFCIKPGLNSPK